MFNIESEMGDLLYPQKTFLKYYVFAPGTAAAAFRFRTVSGEPLKPMTWNFIYVLVIPKTDPILFLERFGSLNFEITAIIQFSIMGYISVIILLGDLNFGYRQVYPGQRIIWNNFRPSAEIQNGRFFTFFLFVLNLDL